MNHSMKSAVESLFVAIGATGFSYILAMGMGWITEVNWIEVASVFTSYSCTYLCVKQSRWNYPIGAVSVALLAYVFFTQSLYGSMALNLYLLPVLVYGWFYWGSDDKTRPVTGLMDGGIIRPLGYVAATLITYAALLGILTILGANLPMLDGIILILSILAQWMLDRKVSATWPVWAVVNVISIYVYFSAGLYFVGIQFILFLANTIYGWYSWNKSMTETKLAIA